MYIKHDSFQQGLHAKNKVSGKKEIFETSYLQYGGQFSRRIKVHPQRQLFHHHIIAIWLYNISGDSC